MDIVDPAAPEESSGIVRDAPTPDPSVAKMVSHWQGRIMAAKKFHKSTFDKMRRDMDFASGDQWIDQSDEDERYVANIVQRHIQQRTAALYAKNPRFFYKTKRKLMYQLWDGRPETLQEAIASISQSQQMLMANPQLAADPMAVQMGMAQVAPAMQLLQDIEQGHQQKKMLEKIGKTLEILAEHELAEQKPPFKKQMKQLIRRAITCAVGYVVLGYERLTKLRPEDAEKIRDYSQQIARLDQLIADAKDGECEAECRQREEIRAMLEDATKDQDRILREGIVVDFPTSASIIIDPMCRQLAGFIGAHWIAREFKLHVDDVKQIYGVDLSKTGYTPYGDRDQRKTDFSGLMSWTAHVDGNKEKPDEHGMCCVWEVQDKDSGLVFTIADGYMDYLAPPSPPEVKLERFWTVFALMFNELENDKAIYPPSDVELLRHIQLERNRSREALREHRIAARPATVSTVPLSDEDKQKLVSHPANAVIELEAAQGAKVQDILQPLQKPGIDPNLYTTDFLDADRALITGTQDAAMGLASSGATATADQIAESSRMTSSGSNVDDLDDFLQELGHAIGHVLLSNMSAEKVKRVVGPGAVWPELSGPEIAEDLMLDVEAGSSGRPNRAAEIANIKEIVPMLIQIPNIDPKWLAKQIIRRMDDKMDIEEAFLEGMPPISALARMMTPLGGGATATGNPATDPAQQGGQGAGNAPKPPGSEMQGPPTPAAMMGGAQLPGPPGLQ